MKEVLESLGVFTKDLGITAGNWAFSTFTAMLFALYSIYEPADMPPRRRVILVLLRAIISAFLIPGLLVYFFKVQNAFVASGITGLSVYCFETVLTVSRGWFIKTIKSKADDSDS